MLFFKTITANAEEIPTKTQDTYINWRGVKSDFKRKINRSKRLKDLYKNVFKENDLFLGI